MADWRPMGRHVDAAETPLDPARMLRMTGLLGGVMWVVKYLLSDPNGAAGEALLWIGGVLLTVAMLGLGVRLVKGDFLLLRLFVALALPTLVWGVLALLRSGSGDVMLVDAVFGVAVALASVTGLRRGAEPHATH
jgi:hypothetical protein